MTDEEGVGTTDESYRWRFLSTIVTCVVTVGYTALVVGQGYGLVNGVTGGTWTVYSIAFLTVVAYSVGTDTLREVEKVREKK